MIGSQLMTLALAGGLLAIPCPAAPAPSNSTVQPPPGHSQSPETQGQSLARKIRSSFPPESATFEAQLKTRAPQGPVRRVPLHCEIQLHDSHWTTFYRTPTESVLIIHYPDQPNEYLLQPTVSSSDPTSSPVRLAAGTAARPLANGDFWFTDLGMEFLHWPQQRLLKTEMRRSRVCHVLESRNPDPSSTNYSRVLCWLDKEHAQPLLAEAYDHHNRLLKEFSIGSLKKVQGRWQVQDMKIVNVQTRSRTWLEFNLDSPP